jgi:ferredoxin-NADP reductase
MAMPRKLRCTVESVTDHGGRVYTVDLKPDMLAPNFHPGQFLHLTVDAYDPSGFWPESRVFSIASSPRARERLRVCYSVKGRYTTKMEQILKPGAEVWVKMPYGEFVIDDSADVVLLAGGTGISAFTAFVEALTPESARRVSLVYGARGPSLLLFREMILGQLGKVPNLDVLFFTETSNDQLTRETAALARAPRCLPGRISIDEMWLSIPQPASKVYYLSGPPVMLATLGNQLQARGVAADRIRTDAWE